MSKLKIVVIVESVIIVALIGTLIFFLLSGKKTNNQNLSSDEIGQKVINYINEKFLQGDTKANLVSVEDKGSVYALVLEIGGKEYTSYATKDGNLLFPEAFNLNPPKPKEFPKTAKPDVKLFVMSFCPFGNQAEEMLIPVVDLLKDKANFELHYIFYNNYASGYPDYCYDKENKYCSMHGIQELHQDIRELCVAKYQKDKLWDFVKAINSEATSQDVDSKWESIAQKLGIDVGKVKACMNNEGLQFLEQETQLTNNQYLVQNPENHNGQEKESISASPTLVINGVIYDGKRSSEDFKKAICSAFENPPQECNQSLENPQDANSTGSCG